MKTPDELRAILRYDPETGKLFWLDVGSPQRRAKYANREAFTSDDGAGYKQGRIEGVQYRAHRVIWAMTYGEWPALQIDHINGERGDNRLANLRLANPSQNGANRHKTRGSSQFVGVHRHKQSGGWVASIQKDGKREHIGLYETEIEALIAYRFAAAQMHGEFAASAEAISYS
ncbi:MAG: HNH endonuclease [Mesorhizobium sp.]|uniref:HNH endonuclease n=1 Tax=Mesorhizobium sp. TaxID=1871066 RepID=UPI000FE5062D|nr:HNH endonuclease [Mesorhizobium sp.]RWO34746.1 MAG: HNH endonuclease [Mesorhizobium sp.]